MTLQAGVLADGQRAGTIRPGDPEALARIFSALVSAHHAIEQEETPAPMHLGIDEPCALVRGAFVIELPSATTSKGHRR